jgi:hypothetical protein
MQIAAWAMAYSLARVRAEQEQQLLFGALFYSSI